MAARFADKILLKRLNDEAIARNYNRQLIPQGVDSLADEAILAIDPIMIHEHAQGNRVEPHLRCSVCVVHPEKRAWTGLMLDVPMDLFELLPEEKDLVREPT